MLRMPSSRRALRKSQTKLNLIPVLDAIFIFIFFLLTSAQFIDLHEINSTKPIVSPIPVDNKKKPLALTIRIRKDNIAVATGVPSRVRKTFGKNQDGEYDTESLHTYIIDLKKRFPKENSVVMEPLIDVPYEKLVKIIDAVRVLRNTDEEIYQKNKEGIEEKIDLLFDKVVFGNLFS